MRLLNRRVAAPFEAVQVKYESSIADLSEQPPTPKSIAGTTSAARSILRTLQQSAQELRNAAWTRGYGQGAHTLESQDCHRYSRADLVLWSSSLQAKDMGYDVRRIPFDYDVARLQREAHQGT